MIDKKEINKLITEGKALRNEIVCTHGEGILFSDEFEYISQIKEWNLKAVSYICDHLHMLPGYNEDWKWDYDEVSNGEIISFLESIIGRKKDNDNMNSEKIKVFIVHGHDSDAKNTVARALEKAGFEAIILHEQASMSMSIIEKIEYYTDVSFAVVLYTECDVGRAKDSPVDNERFRARQNVVFEHGYLISKLGRCRVSALVKGNVELPGDHSGIVYTKMDGDGWKLELAKNMKAVGINFDLNLL